jgi:hypothetical protein
MSVLYLAVSLYYLVTHSYQSTLTWFSVSVLVSQLVHSHRDLRNVLYCVIFLLNALVDVTYERAVYTDFVLTFFTIHLFNGDLKGYDFDLSSKYTVNRIWDVDRVTRELVPLYIRRIDQRIRDSYPRSQFRNGFEGRSSTPHTPMQRIYGKENLYQDYSTTARGLVPPQEVYSNQPLITTSEETDTLQPVPCPQSDFPQSIPRPRTVSPCMDESQLEYRSPTDSILWESSLQSTTEKVEPYNSIETKSHTVQSTFLHPDAYSTNGLTDDIRYETPQKSHIKFERIEKEILSVRKKETIETYQSIEDKEEEEGEEIGLQSLLNQLGDLSTRILTIGRSNRVDTNKTEDGAREPTPTIRTGEEQFVD